MELRLGNWLSLSVGSGRRSVRGSAPAGRHIRGTGTYLSTPVLSGVTVTPQSALGLPAAFASINTIATDVAKLPLNVYKFHGKSGFQPDENHYLYPILRRRPNSDVNAFRRRQTEMGHVLGWGNGYTEIVRERGKVAALYGLSPAMTRPARQDATGALYYSIEGGKRTLLPEDVIHAAGLGFDGILGYPIITLLRQSVGLAIAAEQYGAALFGNSAVPRGFLKTPQKLNDTASRQLRQMWEEVHGGTHNGSRVGVLHNGLDWVPTQMPPDDAQFLATRQFQRGEIASIYRLPPHKIGDYSQAHLANLEESNADYVENTLMGWLTTIEEELNLKLLTSEERKTHFIAHDVGELLRGNLTARTQFYREMRDRGVMTSDEIRGREGMNPLGDALGGNVPFIQMQYIPIGHALAGAALKSRGPKQEQLPFDSIPGMDQATDE